MLVAATVDGPAAAKGDKSDLTAAATLAADSFAALPASAKAAVVFLPAANCADGSSGALASARAVSAEPFHQLEGFIIASPLRVVWQPVPSDKLQRVAMTSVCLEYFMAWLPASFIETP